MCVTPSKFDLKMSQKHPLEVEKVTTPVPFIFESNPLAPNTNPVVLILNCLLIGLLPNCPHTLQNENFNWTSYFAILLMASWLNLLSAYYEILKKLYMKLYII